MNLNIYLAVKFRAFGITFGEIYYRAWETGGQIYTEPVSASVIANRPGKPNIDTRGVRLWVELSKR